MHTAGRLVNLKPPPRALLAQSSALPLALWAHAIGASSVTRSVCPASSQEANTDGALAQPLGASAALLYLLVFYQNTCSSDVLESWDMTNLKELTTTSDDCAHSAA